MTVRLVVSCVYIAAGIFTCGASIYVFVAWNRDLLEWAQARSRLTAKTTMLVISIAGLGALLLEKPAPIAAWVFTVGGLFWLFATVLPPILYMRRRRRWEREMHNILGSLTDKFGTS